MGEGNGVDIVCPAKDFKAEPFDTIISTEAWEHDKDFLKSLANMFSLLKPGGLFLFTCAGYGRKEHGTIKSNDIGSSPFTTSYYKNIEVKDLPPLEKHFSDFEIHYKGLDLYFFGISRR